MWNVTRYRWQVTHDRCNMTCDMWHMIRGGRWTFSKIFSSLALTVLEWRHFEDFEEKDPSLTDWLTDWIKDKGVCRRAPATPGLFISVHNICAGRCTWSVPWEVPDVSSLSEEPYPQYGAEHCTLSCIPPWGFPTTTVMTFHNKEYNNYLKRKLYFIFN